MSTRKFLLSNLRVCVSIIAAVILIFWISRTGADYEDGVNAAFSGDFDTAFREFTVAAEAGLDLAQYNLGILYFTGQGVAQDFGQAFKWTEAAARQGHLNAQFNLGSLYFEGQGVRQSDIKGVEWFVNAARGGHADAAYALARMYQEGEPVDEDLVQAHAWAGKAISNGHEDALALRDELEQDMSAAELSQARRLFARWQLEPLPPVILQR